jgi:hypothetical protein
MGWPLLQESSSSCAVQQTPPPGYLQHSAFAGSTHASHLLSPGRAIVAMASIETAELDDDEKRRRGGRRLPHSLAKTEASRAAAAAVPNRPLQQ